MTDKLLRKLNGPKPKGQALLIVLVISTLLLMLLIGVGNRLLGGQKNIRRSGEFDRAVASAENALNEIIKLISDSDCLNAMELDGGREFTEISLNSCPGLSDLGVQLFGRAPDDNHIPVGVGNPLTLPLAGVSQVGRPSVGVRITCKQEGTNTYTSDTNIQFVVTRVYVENVNGKDVYKLDKGVSNCGEANSNKDSAAGNITFYGVKPDGSVPRVNSGVIDPNAERQNTQLIRVRLLDGSPRASLMIQNLRISGGSTVGDGITGKVEFMIAGLGGLGSDNLITFEKQLGDDVHIPPAFDYVYFGEDL